MRDDYLKCICCDKKQQVLVSVNMESNSIFSHGRGVCQNCLKNEDINNVCIGFEIREAEKSIGESKDSIKQMEEHLKRLRDASVATSEGGKE